MQEMQSQFQALPNQKTLQTLYIQNAQNSLSKKFYCFNAYCLRMDAL